MKEIKAIIQPFKLDEVLAALHEVGNLPSVAVSETSVVDTTLDFRESHPKLKLEVMVPDDLVEKVTDCIGKAAHTGQMGDGRIFIIPIEESILIRTGERGEESR